MENNQKHEVIVSFLSQVFAMLYSNPYIKWASVSLIILLFVYSIEVVLDAIRYFYDFGYEISK